MERSAQLGLGPKSGEEFNLQPGTRVRMDPKVHELTGMVTDVRQDEAGNTVVFVVPWGGEAKPYGVGELSVISDRSASSLDRLLHRAKLRRLS